jgi:hypothetical protein
MLFCSVHSPAQELEQKETKGTKRCSSSVPSFASLPSVQRIGVQSWLRRSRARKSVVKKSGSLDPTQPPGRRWPQKSSLPRRACEGQAKGAKGGLLWFLLPFPGGRAESACAASIHPGKLAAKERRDRKACPPPAAPKAARDRIHRPVSALFAFPRGKIDCGSATPSLFAAILPWQISPMPLSAPSVKSVVKKSGPRLLRPLRALRASTGGSARAPQGILPGRLATKSTLLRQAFEGQAKTRPTSPSLRGAGNKRRIGFVPFCVFCGHPLRGLSLVALPPARPLRALRVLRVSTPGSAPAPFPRPLAGLSP